MRKWLPWLLAVVLALVCALVLRSAGEDPRVGVADAASRPTDAGPLLSAPHTAPREPGPANQPAAPAAIVRGRCVAAETGEPLAECEIRVTGRDRVGGRPLAGWQPPEPARTAADGHFELRVTPSERLLPLCSVSHAARSSIHGQLTLPAAGQVLDLGDLALAAGAQVSGQVLDQVRQPVAGIDVSVQRREPAPGGPLDRSRAVVSARSTSDGSFTFAERLEPGPWTVSVYGPCRLLTAAAFTLAPSQSSMRLELTVERFDPADVLSGTVSDEDGEPAVGLQLWTSHDMTRTGSFSGRIEAGTTDAQGRFRIRRMNPDDGPVQLVFAPGRVTRFEAIDWSESYRWGTTDIRLRVRRGADVELLVVEAGTGTPVEDYGVRCFRDPTGGAFQVSRELQHAGHHTGGRARVETGKPGRNALIVYPSDRELVESAMVRFELGPRQPVALRVELARRTPMPVQVVTTAGTPVPGTRVELLRWEGNGPLTLDTVATTPDVAWSGFSSSMGLALILDAAQTDAEGRATLRGPPSNGTLALKLPGPGCTSKLIDHVSLTPGMATVRLEVAVGATLRGRLVPVALIDKLTAPDTARGVRPEVRRPGLRLALQGSPPGELPRSLPGRPAVFPLAPDGSFTIAAIPPGDVDVLLAWPAGNDLGRRTLLSLRGLRDGEVRDVELDATALLPVTLRGRVTVNGKMLAGEDVAFWCRVPDGHGGHTDVSGPSKVTTDAAGRFQAELMPCECRLVVPLDWQRQLLSEDWIPLVAGVDRDLEFALVRRKFTVRVLEADGPRPAAGRWFEVRSGDNNDLPILTSDADGVVVVDPAQAGNFHLVTCVPGVTLNARGKLLDDPKKLALVELHPAPLTMPQGQLEARTEQRLPSK